MSSITKAACKKAHEFAKKGRIFFAGSSREKFYGHSLLFCCIIDWVEKGDTEENGRKIRHPNTAKWTLLTGQSEKDVFVLSQPQLDQMTHALATLEESQDRGRLPAKPVDVARASRLIIMMKNFSDRLDKSCWKRVPWLEMSSNRNSREILWKMEKK